MMGKVITMDEQGQLEIITPSVANESDALEHGLGTLTEAIAQIDPECLGWGFLGGQFGYGADFENEVFLMHPACGCERWDCPWCADCHCTDAVQCPSCSPSQRWADKGSLPARAPFDYSSERGRAPNFWHKPSGLRVWWYKWIGRGMEVKNADGADLQAIFSECLASLQRQGDRT